MKTEYRVYYSVAAKNDLLSIYRYIAFDLYEPVIAKKQINRLREGIKKLSIFPKKHPSVEWEPWLSMNMRRVTIDNYVVYYLVNDDQRLVTIVRIFYGGRNIEHMIQSAME